MGSEMCIRDRLKYSSKSTPTERVKRLLSKKHHWKNHHSTSHRCRTGFKYCRKLHRCMPTPKCPRGYSLHHGICIKTQTPKCPEGFRRVKHKCVKTVDPQCMKGYSLHKKSGKCVKQRLPTCPRGFKFCKKTKKCMKQNIIPHCAQGFEFCRKTWKCVQKKQYFPIYTKSSPWQMEIGNGQSIPVTNIGSSYT